MIDFEMFSEEGNRACNKALENIKAVINGEKFVSEEEFKKIVKEQIDQVDAFHREVHDTEPEWHFEVRINRALETRGYAYKVNRGDF